MSETAPVIHETTDQGLGLVDGAFAVGRDDDSWIDYGWQIEAYDEETDKVTIVKPQDDGSSLVKTVPRKKLVELNEQLHRDVTTKEVGSVAVNNQLASESRESLAQQHYEALFAPVSGQDNPDDQNFDHLFSGDPKDTSQNSVEQAAVRDKKNSREYVTDENCEAAAQKLVLAIQADRYIESAFNQVGVRPETELEAVTIIRTNAKVRQLLGMHYLQKVNERAHELPERIRRNAQKVANHVGYAEPMTSREYVALLCLAMIDGSYDNDGISSNDTIQHDEKGAITIGQHRSAALEVLFNN